MLRQQLCSVALAALLAVPACAMRKPGSELKPGFNLFSKEQDVQIGQQAAQQVQQQYEVVQNRELQDYVTRIGRRLASQAEADKYPYSFTLVNERSINAFALPGGPTFLHTGLILAADNEAQVAGVIAHEIAHVALRHGTNQASKANLLQLPAVLAGAVTGSNLIAQLTQLGAMGVMLKFSRSAESQADALGAQLMAKAGYNPIEMARFFEKLEAEGGSRAPQFLSDHPSPGNRIRAVQEEIRAFPQRSYNFTAGDFQRIKNMTAQLPAGRGRSAPTFRGDGSGAQPQSRGQVPAPAGGFRQLRGREFALSYPENWEVFGDNGSAMITIAPREGIVQGSRGGGGIGYGAIVSYYFPESGRRDLREATEELIHHLHAGNPTMQVASRDRRRLRIDGSPAMVTQLRSESPFGGDETDVLLTVERPQGLFYMVFIAPSREFRNLERIFDEMVRSIRFSN